MSILYVIILKQLKMRSMKKVLLILALATTVIIGFSSCRKCQICTKESKPDIRVCEDSYGSNTEYGLVLDGYQLDGYVCQ